MPTEPTKKLTEEKVVKASRVAAKTIDKPAEREMPVPASLQVKVKVRTAEGLRRLMRQQKLLRK